MATTADDIKTKYPLPVWQYQVQVGEEDMAFSEVSGLNIEYETISYADGMGVKHMPGKGTPVELSLQKGIVNGDTKLLDWITSIKLNTVDKKDITISLLDEEGENPLVTWTVVNAFPTNLEAPTFDANNNEVAIETLSLMADDLKVEYK
jgi:phage tail-like protein